MKDGFKFCKKETCENKNPQPVSNFVKHEIEKDGLLSWCRDCKRVYDAKRYQARKSLVLGKSKAYYDSNKEKVQKRHDKWRVENKAKTAQYHKEYLALYPEKSRAKVRKYTARKSGAAPKWLSKEQISQMEQIYMTCPKGFEVDHIIPLQGKNVCGLHVPWNLQHLSAAENRKKSNKY